MNRNPIRDSETRSALEKTLNTLEQLTELKGTYAMQEMATDAEIAMLELRLKDVKQQRTRIIQNNLATSKSITQMEDVVQNLRGALSPMRRIPDEILLHVFSLICQELSTRRAPNPIVLSCVCSRWRSIMTSNMSLWGIVSIQMDSISSGRERAAQIAKYMLDRGRGSQRCLLLEKWTPARHGSLQHLISTNETSSPFQKIVIRVSDSGAGWNTWNIEHYRATEVHIHLPKAIPYEKFIPLLRYSGILQIWGQPLDLVGMPWVNLKSLALNSIPNVNPSEVYVFGRQKLIDILRAAPHLTELSLHVPPKEGDIRLPENIFFISHSKLEVLRLPVQYFAANGVPLGVHLDAPGLREVTLYSLKRHAETNEASFFRNWEAPIHLILPPFQDYDVASAAELIYHYPCVETLDVEGRNIDKLFIVMHTLLNDTPPEADLPLPKLVTLQITDSDLRGETLLEFLDARLRHVRAGTPGMRAMTKVVMYESPGVSPEDWKVVNERLEEGRILNERCRNVDLSSMQQAS